MLNQVFSGGGSRILKNLRATCLLGGSRGFLITSWRTKTLRSSSYKLPVFFPAARKCEHIINTWHFFRLSVSSPGHTSTAVCSSHSWCHRPAATCVKPPDVELPPAPISHNDEQQDADSSCFYRVCKVETRDVELMNWILTSADIYRYFSNPLPISELCLP